MSAVGSIPDEIMSRLLINERMVENLKMLIDVKRETKDNKGLSDLYSELYFRTMHRESLFYKEKRKESLRMDDLMSEASKYMGK